MFPFPSLINIYFIFANLLIGINYIWPKNLERKIVWNETDYPWLLKQSEHSIFKEIIRQNLNIIIKSPCDIFMEKSNCSSEENSEKNAFCFSLNIESNNYYQFCNEIYDKFIVNQINQNCPSEESIENRINSINGLNFKNKRSLFKNRLNVKDSTITAISVLNTYGFEYFRKILSSDGTHFKMYQQAQANLFKISQNISNEIHKELFNQIFLLNNNVEQLNRTFINYQIEVNNLIKIYNFIIMKLYQTELLFRNFFHELKSNRISKEFSLLFPNIKLCDNCPQQYWIGHGCTRLKASEKVADKNSIIIKLSMTIFTVSIEHIIIKIDPFTIMRSINDQFCFFNYNGNNYLIYDKTKQCFHYMDWQPNDRSSAAIMYDFMVANNQNCFQLDQLNLFNYWQKNICINQSNIDARNIIQIKCDKQFVYVYCYTLEMEIFIDNTNQYWKTNCNNTVYKIANNITKIKIGNFSIMAEQFRFELSLIQYIDQEVFPFKMSTSAGIIDQIINKSLVIEDDNNQPKNETLKFDKILHLLDIEENYWKNSKYIEDELFRLKQIKLSILILILFGANVLLFVLFIFICYKCSC